MLSTFIAVAGVLVAGVSAHGAVTSYEIGGVTYPGYTGYSPSSSPPTIEWQWTSYNPVLSITDAAMTCNSGTSAGLSATIAAGEDITAFWAQWTHQQGPVMVWMYDCGSSFSSCTGKGNNWFKIDQMGMTAPPLTGTSWGTAVVEATLKWTSTIPAQLAPGNYLIRHELLALHQAYTPQWYMECAQLVVTGSGTEKPSGSYLTPIPAYASASDPGVYIDIYTSTATTYTCPGPDVWPPAGGASNPPPPPASTSTKTTVTTVTSAPHTTSSPTTTAVGTPSCGAAKYAQCGGTGFTGCTTCQAGSSCSAVSPPYYYQCL